MRFIYILSNNEIVIEIQQNRDKLSSPFIRNKKIVANLSQELTRKEDKLVFEYIKLLNQSKPPFKIDKNFLSLGLVNLIKSINFIFTRKNTKASFKRLTNLSHLDLLVSNQIQEIIVPRKLKILINSLLKDKVDVSYFFEFDEIEKDIPIDYNLEVPLIDRKILATIDIEHKNKLLNIFKTIVNKDALNTKYLTLSELNILKENELISIQYKIDSKRQKSVDFVSNTLFKMKIFDKDNLSSKDLDFYYSMLENYLQNKNYVEYNDKLIFFDNKNIIKDIDNKTLLKTFSHNLNQNVKTFINKIINIKNLVDKEKMLKEIKLSGFKATLKEYQEDGVLWLYNLYKNNLDGGLLADEMGLGKTIQVIAFLLLSKTKNNLIIAPASLIHNWKNEILKFTNIKDSDISLNIKDNSFITILSYEYARSKIEILKKQKFDLLIIDESQKIKNNKTKIFNAIAQIKRDFTIIMTGTPIENSLNDLWNMLLAINPSLYEIYKNKIQPLLLDKENYSKAIELTINILHPVIMQRKKKDVLNLPKRDTKIVFIEFTNLEKEKYNQLTNIFISALKSGLSGRIQSIALEGLLRLRQYCSIHSIIPQSLLATNNLEDSKVKKALDIIKNTINSNEKIIIFSQFTTTLDKLESIFKKLNYNYLRLDGSTTKSNRNKYIGEFQNVNSKYNIFLISLKAGGVGLNLTSARSAILFEPWWNPAVEEQAFARIDRIGQKKTIKIYRLIYKDSIEEKINNLIQQKKDIFNSMTKFLNNSKSLKMEVAKEIFNIYKD